MTVATPVGFPPKVSADTNTYPSVSHTVPLLKPPNVFGNVPEPLIDAPEGWLTPPST